MERPLSLYSGGWRASQAADFANARQVRKKPPELDLNEAWDNLTISAAFWPKSEDRRCFILLARRQCRLAVTGIILDEYRSVIYRIGRRECPDRNPTPFLDWIERVALLVEPSPLGKRRSRDVKDAPFLACALASRAGFIVTKDRDLLALDKPFGIEIVTPKEFYRRLEDRYWRINGRY